MKLLSLHLTNFRQHADSTITFPPDGLIGLIGSNEAGKSTVLEGILFALYGTVAIRGKLDGLRWHGAPARKQAAVDLVFEVGGVMYRLERTESDATLRLHLFVGDGSIIAQGTKPVNEAIPKLLGMAYAEFAASFLVLQKDVSRIGSMGPTERTALIRKLLGVDKIDDGLKLCRKRKAALAQEMAGIEAGLGPREPVLASSSTALVAVSTALSTVAHATATAETVTSAATDARTALTVSEVVRVRHDALGREIHQEEQAGQRAAAALAGLAKKLQEADAAKGRLDAAAAQLATLPALGAERDALRDARATGDERRTLIVRLEGLREQARQAEATATALRAKAIEFDEEVLALRQTAHGQAGSHLGSLVRARYEALAAAGARATGHEHRASELRAQYATVSALGADGACPTCTRVLGSKALQAVLITLHDELTKEAQLAAESRQQQEAWAQAGGDEQAAERAEAQHRAALEQYIEVQRRSRQAATDLITTAARCGDLARDIATSEARIAELPAIMFDAERLTAIEWQVRDLEVLDAGLAKDRGLVAGIPDIRVERIGWLASDVVARDEVARLTAERRALAFSQPAHDILVTAAVTCDRAAQDAKIALARAEERLTASRTAYGLAQQRLADYDARADGLEAVKAAHLTHERVDARLAEFRVAIVGTIRPEMEELVSGFVSVLTDGRHEAVSVTEEFAVVAYEGGVECPIVSGGTEDVVALAMRLALSQMIVERAGHPLSLLVLDEVFGALDERRRGAVMALLKMLRQTFMQVLVVSHVAETRDLVDHAIELEYSESAGRTYVKGAAR